MKTYEIEYVTGEGTEGNTTVNAVSKTEAYLSFTFANPINYIVTEMREVGNV